LDLPITTLAELQVSQRLILWVGVLMVLGSIETVIGLIKGKHKVNTDIVVNDQDSNGYFASVALMM
jgi:hypothetical protein